MRKYFKLLFIFVVISVFSVSYMQAKEPGVEGKNIAMDFKLQDLNQNTFTLSSYKDKQAVILFFWTTWCPLCRNELRLLKGIYPELKKENLQLLAIDVGEPAYIVDKAVKDNALNFTVLLDRDTTLAWSYGIFGVPTYFIVDKGGFIVFKDHYFPKEKYKELISK